MYLPSGRFVLAVAWLATACSGDSSTDPNGNGNGGDADWSVEQLAEAITRVEDVVRSTLPPPGAPRETRDVVAELEAVVAALAEQPEVLGVVLYRNVGSAQALLQDGTSVVIINNRPYEDADEGSGAVLAADGGGSAARSAPVLPTFVGPPGSADAVVAAVDGGDAVAAEIRTMLAGAGYRIRPLGGSLADMRNYTNLGALYLDTHGGAYRRAIVTTGSDGRLRAAYVGDIIYVIETSTVVSQTELESYAEELKSGEVVVSMSNSESGVSQATFGITETFIQRHWSFDHGVVVLHVCYAGGGQIPIDVDNCTDDECPGFPPSWDPTILRNAMLAQGVDVVIATDHLTNATYARPSLLYLFDRLLGADSHEPLDPPARPFDAMQVRAAMAADNLLTYESPGKSGPLGRLFYPGNVVTITFTGEPADAILAPTIEQIDVLDDAAQSTGTLMLHGKFGEQPGEVQVDGRQVTVDSWTADALIARVPFEGYAGDVVVRAPGDVESNAVPLTEWRGRVTLTFFPDLGSLRAIAEMDVVFRADIHPFRITLTGNPHDRTATSYISPASEGTARGQGSHAQGDATVTWLGEDDMRVLSKAEVDGGFAPLTASSFGGYVRLDPAAGSAELCMIIIGMVTVRTQGQGFPTQEAPAPLLITPPHLLGSSLLGCVPLEMRQNHSLAADSYDFQLDDGVFFRLEWTDFQPDSAPDDDTPG
jgi:hypothetical protein